MKMKTIDAKKEKQQVPGLPRLAMLDSGFSRNEKGLGSGTAPARLRMGRNDKVVGELGVSPGAGSESDDAGAAVWARRWSLAGAGAWAGLAVLARMGIARFGVIELMFLLAPLVIVPLGLELGRARGKRGLAGLAQTLQPVGAACAVVAMLWPPGKWVGVAAAGWMVVCGLAAIAGASGLLESFRDRVKEVAGGAPSTRSGQVRATFGDVAANVALVDLAVGGAWLVASRLGMRPMGVQEPIGLLTAVHFHFAGFATAMIASVTLGCAEKGRRWLRGVVMAVLVLPVVVAAGFVASPALKMAAAFAFSISVAGLAMGVVRVSSRVEAGSARVFLRMAAGAVFAGVALSATYAVTDFLKSDALTIPRMATTHGVLNGVGFCLCGLLGWLVESSERRVPSRG